MIDYGLVCGAFDNKLLNHRDKPITAPLLYAVIAPALAAAVFAIWKIYDFNNAMSNIGDNAFAQSLGASVSVGFGLYLIIIAGIGLTICAFLMQDKNEPVAISE